MSSEESALAALSRDELGIDPENLRLFEHAKEKLSHYSKRTVDIEYRFGFTGSEFGELEGIANRTDFDLKTHSEHSGKDLSYFDQTKNERGVPFCVSEGTLQCPCKRQFGGAFCDECAPGYYNFPTCTSECENYFYYSKVKRKLFGSVVDPE